MKENDKLIKCDYPVIDGVIQLESIDLSNIPDGEYSLLSKMKWFSEFVDKYGRITEENELEIKHANIDFLVLIRLFLQTCGVASYVDSRLLVTSCDLFKLKELGFSPKRLDIEDLQEPQRNSRQFIKIIKRKIIIVSMIHIVLPNICVIWVFLMV